MKRSFAKILAIAGLNVLALGAANAQASRGCSNATIQGTFAYTSTGSIIAPPEIAGPVAEVGTQTFDGSGNTTAVATLSSNGTILPLTISGTYKVNSDCTGTATLQVLTPFQAEIDVYFVIDQGGDGFQGMETNNGFVISRVARRLFPGRAI